MAFRKFVEPCKSVTLNKKILAMNKPFEPVGVCIYCGSTEQLTDEHIVPYGLNGDLTLPQASCTTCNRITSLFEQKVLRGPMSEARIVGKLKTRNKKERPTSIRLNLIRADESVEQLDIPADDAMAFLPMLILTEASFPYGHPACSGIQIKALETLKFGRDVAELLVDKNAVGISGRTRIHPQVFGQLLAKIAYSYHVGVKGRFPMSESPALALLKGEVKDISNWIGSTFLPVSPASSTGLHRLATKTVVKSDGSSVELVLIQLFANAGTCTYEVVVRAKDWMAYLQPAPAAPGPHSQPTLA